MCLEMLNSRVDVEMKGHPGYQCDSIEWAADVCNRIGSPRVKILFLLGPSYTYQHTRIGSHRYRLLAPFVEGMCSVADAGRL